MKLFLVHCGFYDAQTCDGIYESHANYFLAAESFEDARAKAKLLPEYKAKHMHVDGLQEISAVSGMKILLEADESLKGQTVVTKSQIQGACT